MFILIDLTALRMVASAKKKAQLDLAWQLDFPQIEKVTIVSSEDGRSWTCINRADMATLFKNMSGQDAPEYSDCIEQLRAYSESWADYPQTLEQLEARYAAEVEPEEDEPDPVAEQKARNKAERAAHQAAIAATEQANAALPPEQRIQEPVTKPKAPHRENAEPRRAGSTKRVWDIGDEIYAENERKTGMLDMRTVRAEIMARCTAEGINSGTAATQYGKWRSERGYK